MKRNTLNYLNMKKRFILFITFCVLCISAKGQEDTLKLKPIALVGGAGMNFSFHSADFTALPGIINCCSGYTGGFGLNPTFLLGAEFFPDGKLFDMPYRYGIRVGYSGANGDLTTEEFSFNKIEGNNVEQVISRHTLTTKLPLIVIEPSLVLYPIENNSLGIIVGLSGGLFMSKTFVQSQEIIQPSNILWLETGSTVKGSASGDIPQAGSLFIAPLIGVRYDIPLNEQWAIIPSITALPQITSFVSSLDWNALHTRAMVEIQYRLAEPQPEKIAPPPPPPPPPAPKRLELAVTLKKANGDIVKDGEKIRFTIVTTKTRYSHDAAPILFFRKSSSEISPIIPLSETSSEETAQTSVLIGLVSLLKADADSKVELKGISAADESPELAKQRAENVASYLFEQGIDKSQVRISSSSQSGTIREIREELLDEDRSVRIFVNGSLKTIPVVYEKSDKKSDPIQFSFEPIIVAEAAPYQAFGKLDFEMRTVQKLDITTRSIIVNPDDLFASSPTKAKLDYALADAEDRRTAAGLGFTFIPDNKETIIENRFGSGMKTDEYILGYFNFDGTDFSAINEEAVKTVREALQVGKKVELYPKTDNFGTGEYNMELAKSRLKSALKLLNTKEESIIIRLDNVQQNYDPSAVSRILHRTVIAKIID